MGCAVNGQKETDETLPPGKWGEEEKKESQVSQWTLGRAPEGGREKGSGTAFLLSHKIRVS